MKLDLGTGNAWVYPLQHPDETADEICANGVLNHFPPEQAKAVLTEWVRVLKKGGRLRVAVPDFEKLSDVFAPGSPFEAYFNAQIDPNTLSAFTFNGLRLLFSELNLVLFKRWEPALTDAKPLFLNVEAYKPHFEEFRVSGAMSVPRLGFMDNFFCAMEAAVQCGVRFHKHDGPFWGQSMTKVIDRIMKEEQPHLLLTVDYDTLFKPWHLAQMIQLMMLYPDVDALAPIQSSRHLQTALFTVKGENGNEKGLPRAALAGHVCKVSTAHFGLTLLRADKVRDLPKPWFHSQPSPTGEWGEGSVDEDIGFWRKWEAAGNSLYLACRIAVGHAELMGRWPDMNLLTFYQPIGEFQTKGLPEGVWQ